MAVTHDGQAIAIRRAQDARSARHDMLGIRPKRTATTGSAANSAPAGSKRLRLRLKALAPSAAQSTFVQPRRIATTAPSDAELMSLLFDDEEQTSEVRAVGAQAFAPAAVRSALLQNHAAIPGSVYRPLIAPADSLPSTRLLPPPRQQHPPPSTGGNAATYCQMLPNAACATLAPSEHQRVGRRRTEASTAPPTPCTRVMLPSGLPAFKGKGSKHVSRCAGPWVSAMTAIPPLQLTGAKRARAGMADVLLPRAEQRAVKQERAARCLVAILPYGCASFILRDPAELVARRAADATAELMVKKLAGRGTSSLEGAYGLLGRLQTWFLTTHPDEPVIAGSHFHEWVQSAPQSASTFNNATWLRDWTGVDLPARDCVALPPRRGSSDAAYTRKQNSRESFSLAVVLGLEAITASELYNEQTRGHAAGWHYLAKHMSRLEQTTDHSINSFVEHVYLGTSFYITCASTARDKHTNPIKQRPRPVWGCTDSVSGGPECRDALIRMLDGAEGLHSLLRDTDSESGSPCVASRWLLAPLVGSRAEASLQRLLQLPEIGMSLEQAKSVHPHGAKRFMANVAEASEELSATDVNELGRFSGSTAQNADLEPSAAMLQQHTARVTVMPALYASESRVTKVFDIICRAQLALRRAAANAAANPALLELKGGWGADGAFSSMPRSLALPQPPGLPASAPLPVPPEPFSPSAHARSVCYHASPSGHSEPRAMLTRNLATRRPAAPSAPCTPACTTPAASRRCSPRLTPSRV